MCRRTAVRRDLVLRADKRQQGSPSPSSVCHSFTRPYPNASHLSVMLSGLDMRGHMALKIAYGR